MSTDEIQQIWQFALLGLGIGALIAGHRPRRRPLLPRVGRDQPRQRRHRDVRRLHLLGAADGPSVSGSRVIPTAPCARDHVRRHRRLRRRDGAARLQAAPGRIAAGEARCLARRPADAAGIDARRLRRHPEAAASGAAAEPPGRAPGRHRGARPPADGGDRHRGRGGARGSLPLEPLRTRDAGRIGGRGLGDTRGAVAEQPVDDQHDARLPRRGRARRARRVDHVLYWQTLPLYIVPALAAALFARFTSFGIACAVGLLLGMAQSVLLYYMAPKPWFPDRPHAFGQLRAARRLGPVRVPRDRGRDVLARREPARPRRADREAPAVRSPVRAPGPQRPRRGRCVRGRARRPPLGLSPGADRLAPRVADLPLVRHHHRLRRADLRRAGRPRRRGRLHRLEDGDELRDRVPPRAR